MYYLTQDICVFVCERETKCVCVCVCANLSVHNIFRVLQIHTRVENCLCARVFVCVSVCERESCLCALVIVCMSVCERERSEGESMQTC